MATVEKLESVIDQIFNYIAVSVAELNNDEAEYVMEVLIEKFEGLLERSRATRR